MPYWLHRRSDPPESGRWFTSRGDAAQEKDSDHAITFVLTPGDREYWQQRERGRFADHTYVHVPWYGTGEPFYTDHWMRYPHLSISHPGLVAYTPDDEFGAQDRQLRVRPGKYLKQFLPQLGADAIEHWANECRARCCTTQHLQLARTADDIVRVFVGGPDSCMSAHKADVDGRHPVEVYGDSDLAVAYLGPIDAATARAVVWPAEHLYNRSYGDPVLKHVLHLAGYSVGSLDGAHVRAIRIDGDDMYLMPYIDGINGATLHRDGRFCLDGGPYETQRTDGRTGDEPDVCAHCEDAAVDEEYAPYCGSCGDIRWSCARCDHDYFHDGAISIDRYGAVCQSCADVLTSECALCSEAFYEVSLRRSEQETRRYRPNHRPAYARTICPDCQDGARYCGRCSEWFHTTDANRCPECFPKPRVVLHNHVATPQEVRS